MQAIVEEVKTKSSVSNKVTSGQNVGMSVKDLLAREASHKLESKRNLQITATKEKTLNEIKKEMGIPLDSLPTTPEEQSTAPPTGARPKTARRRVRQKMRSTPVVGGSLFDNPNSSGVEKPKAQTADGSVFTQSLPGSLGGRSAELVVDGEVYKIRVTPQTVHRVRSGYSGELLDDSSVNFSSADVPIEHRLEGFVRTSALQTISEDVSETDISETDRDDW